MSFQDYFIHHKNPHGVEAMYQAFKERMYHEAETGTDWDLIEEAQRASDNQISEAAEDNFYKYSKTEHYREQWAIKKGYTFKPKEYNPTKRYK